MYKYKYSTLYSLEGGWNMLESFLFPNPSLSGLKEGIAFVAVELFNLWVYSDLGFRVLGLLSTLYLVADI